MQRLVEEAKDVVRRENSTNISDAFKTCKAVTSKDIRIFPLTGPRRWTLT